MQTSLKSRQNTSRISKALPTWVPPGHSVPWVWGKVTLEERTPEQGDDTTEGSRRQWWKWPKEFLSTESLIFVFQLPDVCHCHIGLFGFDFQENVPCIWSWGAGRDGCCREIKGGWVCPVLKLSWGRGQGMSARKIREKLGSGTRGDPKSWCGGTANLGALLHTHILISASPFSLRRVL